jgi:hypothetical protein
VISEVDERAEHDELEGLDRPQTSNWGSLRFAIAK